MNLIYFLVKGFFYRKTPLFAFSTQGISHFDLFFLCHMSGVLFATVYHILNLIFVEKSLLCANCL